MIPTGTNVKTPDMTASLQEHMLAIESLGKTFEQFVQRLQPVISREDTDTPDSKPIALPRCTLAMEIDVRTEKIRSLERAMARLLAHLEL